MLAKLTSKNQLTLPKSVVEAVAASEYFDVEVREGQIVLPGIGRQFAEQLAGGDPAAVDRCDAAEQIGPVGYDDVLAYFTGDEFS